jgi:hypothetical protein
VAGVGEGPDQFVKADGRADRDDVASSDANLAGGAVAEMQEVAEHQPLGRAEVAGDGPSALRLVHRILDLVAQGRFGFVAEDQRPHPAPQARAATDLIVGIGRHHAVSTA